MKKMILVIVGLFLAQSALAETLTCYNAYTKQMNPKPVFTAKIISNSQLDDIAFAGWMKTSSTGLQDAASLSGMINDSHHSPYRGAMKFDFANGDLMYLPADLSAKSLSDALTKGIGYGKDENGVIIGNAKDYQDGAGNHYSYRLRCESDQK